MRHHNHLDFRRPSELDNSDNRVLRLVNFDAEWAWLPADTNKIARRASHLMIAIVATGPFLSGLRSAISAYARELLSAPPNLRN